MLGVESVGAGSSNSRGLVLSAATGERCQCQQVARNPAQAVVVRAPAVVVALLLEGIILHRVSYKSYAGRLAILFGGRRLMSMSVTTFVCMVGRRVRNFETRDGA